MNMRSKKILIAGGAGYIGSHTAKALKSAGYNTLVFDNLLTGHKEFLRFGEYIIGDLADKECINKVFIEHNIDIVMHFAALAYVGESVISPAKYYRNNISNTLNLLEAMLEHECKYFIFSSTCATYGMPQYLPLTEEHAQNPINPYGRSKLYVERMLEDFGAAYGIKYMILRYFNAAGADPDGQIGEWHEPETHLIPLILRAAIDSSYTVKIFGNDYPTFDGTCIRDYIHVNDLAAAHILAMERLLENNYSSIYNLGNGRGYSINEIIKSAIHVTGRQIKLGESMRRPGDPPVLIGDGLKAMRELGWKPEWPLDDIMHTAWNWIKNMPYGH